jgi:3-dehydrosphinganine reductase
MSRRPPLRLRDGHALVTGGTSGIGLALVHRLVAGGARVSVLALDDDDLARLRATPPPGRHPLHLAPVDVRDRDAVEEAVGGCLVAHGTPELVVTSAGVARPGRFLELPHDEFERQLHVNYLGTLWTVRAAAPAMVAQGRGAIAMLSSFAGWLGVYGYGAYAPSKYAVRGLAETLRCELKPAGVHVAAVFPTDVDTPQLAGEEPHKPPETRALSSSAALQTPGQVADAILRGVARGRPRVFCDRRSALLARVAATAPGVAERIVDRTIARS